MNIIHFYRTNSTYGCFSNFSRHGFLLDGSEMKQFCFDLDETLKYTDSFSDYGAIIKVDVPTGILNDLNITYGQIDAFIFRSGVLTIENKLELRLLNSSVKNIEHAY